MAFKTVFDADFKYRSADTTDVRLTFARIRREQARMQKRLEQERHIADVVPITSANDQNHAMVLKNEKIA